MKKTTIRSKCPHCGSSTIHTDGKDQMCLDCDWNNFAELVHAGQLDNLPKAFCEHFGLTEARSEVIIDELMSAHHPGL